MTSQRGKPILNEDGDPIPQIGDGMGANFKEVLFAFYADAHIFVFDCGNISPKQFERALGGILGHDDVKARFGPVSATILPTSDALEKLLELPKKTKIVLKYTLPNGDVADEEGRIMQRLDAMGASAVEKKITSQSKIELKPDGTLMAEMNIASANGYVMVHHTGPDGKTHKKSTKKIPRTETVSYDSPEGYWDALDSAAEEFVSDHGGRHGPNRRR